MSSMTGLRPFSAALRIDVENRELMAPPAALMSFREGHFVPAPERAALRCASEGFSRVMRSAVMTSGADAAVMLREGADRQDGENGYEDKEHGISSWDAFDARSRPGWAHMLRAGARRCWIRTRSALETRNPALVLPGLV